jgi:VanZ family protein
VRRALARVAPAFIWAGVIFTLSAQPEPPHPAGALFVLLQQVAVPPEVAFALDFLVRKAAHFGEYAVLALLVHYGLGLRDNLGRGRRYLLAWVLSALYAASDELHQSFVPGRGPAVAYVIIDACGALAALAAHSLVEHWQRARRGPAAPAVRELARSQAAERSLTGDSAAR